MSHAIDDTAFARGTDPLFELLTPEQIQRLTTLVPKKEIGERVEYLAELAEEGTLSPEELAEYEGYIRANNFLAIMQGIARRRLHGSSGTP